MISRKAATFKPKVSIVIPVYNGSNFLSEAIDSALAQTYDNVEVVVVNDGSTDNGATEKIALSYGNRIHYYSKENGGVATALNYGIEKMQGDYFSWLSHDDLYENTKIEAQVAYLASSGKHDTIVACNASVLFENGIKKKEYIDEKTFLATDVFLATSAITGVNGCSLLIPKKALVRSGGFDNNLPYTQDYDLWFRLVKDNDFHLLSEHLVISRRHEGQDSVQKQLLCFRAAESLHYGFLNDISYDRFESFFKADTANIDNFLKNYETYKTGGYKKTASMMLRHLLRYYADHDKAKHDELFASEIGRIVAPFQFRPVEKGNGDRPRVVFFSNVWNRGGIERVLSFIFEHFGDRYQFILVTCENNSDENFGYPLPATVGHIKIRNQNQLAELANIISVADIDVFVGNPNFSPEFIDIYPVLEGMDVKSVAYNHGHYFLPYTTGDYLYPTALKIKDRYRAADYVIWLSEVACNLYNLENYNGLYIPNPVLFDKRVEPRKKAAKKILSVGRFDDEVKRIDSILLVFKELHKIDREYRLTIVGYCPMDITLPSQGNAKLGDFIKQQNIPVENIDFVGSQDDVQKFYDESSFLLQASRCEGFALVLVEAMSRGVPCAGFDYLGIEEIIESGHNGWTRPQGDYRGLAQDIAMTISDTSAFRKMSQYALESAARFDVTQFYRRWDTLLNTLTRSTVKKDMGDLLPGDGISEKDFSRIVIEYEHALNDVINNRLYGRSTIDDNSSSESRVGNIGRRVKTSINRDGLYLTGEKAVRKAYRKLKTLAD